MDNLLTKATSNYTIQTTRYSLGAFTQYSGTRQNKVQAITGWQPKAIFPSAFIAAISLLKTIYISTQCAVNYVQFKALWQYNKALNVDCRTDAVFLKVRCIAGYLKRWAS
jgi:hypothetical protein